MKYSISYNENFSAFIIKTHGDFEINSFERLTDELLSDEMWASGSNCLFDYRDTSFLYADLLTFKDASTMHKKNNSAVGSGKSALVMKDHSNFCLGTMHQNITEHKVETKFFITTDFDKAVEWLISDDE